jgi:hypothetical protein
MTLTKPLFDIRYFQGINNVAPANKVIPRGGKSYLTSGVNIDIDGEGMIHDRDGYAAASYSGTGIHSLWGNGETCLFVEGSDLKILNLDYTATTVRASVGAPLMAYVDVARRIYYTNTLVIGYVKDRTGYTFAAPTMTYKSPMPAGQLIEWYNGRLYVAKDNVLWASDPMYPSQTDSRKGFKQFQGRIGMMRAVRETGIYVGDSFKTYLLAGLDMNDFSLVDIADFPPIPGTDVEIDGSKLPEPIAGKVLLWLSKYGVCLAGKGRLFRTLTRDTYWPASTAQGAAVVRETNGIPQYLVSQAT